MASESFLKICDEKDGEIFNLLLSTWVTGEKNYDYKENYKKCKMELKHLISNFFIDRRISLYLIDVDFKNHVFRKNHPVYIKFKIMCNFERKIGENDMITLINEIEKYLVNLDYLMYSIKRPKKTT